MTLLNLAYHYFGERSKMHIVQKYDLNLARSRITRLDILMAFAAMTKRQYVHANDLQAFFGADIEEGVVLRAWRYRLQDLLAKGYIFERKSTRDRGSGYYGLSVHGRTILNEYLSLISEGIEGLLDTGQLPDYLVEEHKEYMKIHKEIKWKR